ncbi:MAG TPA: DUF1501 domain-containing protein [Frankiaceae bacterium]|nr:DUF1501 domain-containing protein [Frankiaceae bacterium]
MTTVTRRTVLKGAGAAVGAYTLAPLLGGSTAWAAAGPQAAARRRLVVLDLSGGNDGLNTVVPRTGLRRTIYDQVRPTIGLPVEDLLPLDRGGNQDDGSLGLHPSLATLHRLYRADRVAVVQGVDYPNHNYSHFTSNDIWQAGNPENIGDSGWIGRHLDRVGVAEDELRAVGVGGTLARAIRGETHSGMQVNSLAATRFADGETPIAVKRHSVYAGYSRHTQLDPAQAAYGGMCAATVRLSEETRGLSAAEPGGLANAFLTARTLLESDLGVEIVFITTGGYDTHAGQGPLHESLLKDLDLALEAFYFGTRDGVAIAVGGAPGNGLPGPLATPAVPGTPIGPLAAHVADRTLLMTFSEFGRRIGENASGTDHGAAAPMLLVGPPPGANPVSLVPGLHSDHPPMGSAALPADNLAMTVDLRSVYQAVLTKWVNDPDGARPDEGDPAFELNGTNLEADGSLAGLFTTGAPSA